jgi:hypothetical protein
MGLSVSVGFLNDLARNDTEGFAHYQGAFARLTKALADKGITWSEPEVGEPPADPLVSAGFPYRYLTHLRRVHVLARLGEPVTPAQSVDEEQYDLDREKIDDEMTMFDSHLLCHADNAGYYVPVDFSDPLFLPEGSGVAGGGMVGSSQRLLAELVRMAPALGIHLDAAGAMSPDEESVLRGLESGARFEQEIFTWHQLYRACRASVASGHAIVFS